MPFVSALNNGRPMPVNGPCSTWGRRTSMPADAVRSADRSWRSTGSGRRWPTQAAALAGIKGLVALDGNWAQAKALWWRNPWLTRLQRVVVVPDAPSLYGSLRREARPEALSTLEAVALALATLEHDPTVRDRILAPFRELIRRARAAGIRDSKRDRRSRR